jgi:ABC-type sugar transport system ATPase subunit
MNLSLQSIDKLVNQEIYLKDVNLEFQSGSHNVLLGRTLSGKTSSFESWQAWIARRMGKFLSTLKTSQAFQ